MAGTSKLFNVPANTLVPGPRLVIVQGGDGKCTATMDFTCRKFDLSGTAIQNKLTKGNAITNLYSDAGVYWNFLKLESYTSQDEPGGITTVTCNFAGTTTDGGFSSEDSIVYTRNNALRDESIFNHPTLIAELSQGEVDGIRAVVAGEAYLDGTDIKRNSNDSVIETLSTEGQEWYDVIVRQGWETYPLPTSEWTKTATGQGALTVADLGKLGKQDTPPGDPYIPTGQKWVMTGCTENIQVLGEGQNSYSITWTSGNWPDKIYPTT